MSDLSYQPKTYRKDGGDTFVVAAGGQILVEPGGSVMGGNPYGGADYWVDGNVLATGDGSLNDPYLTLKEAITASNISIGDDSGYRWWARRNRIFVCGDQEIDEDLTTFPEKCDVIGFGFDLEPMPRIIGHHIIAAQPTGKAYGTRFINCGFMNDDAGEHFHFLSDHMCVEFHGCILWPLVTGSTHCIRLATSNRGFKFINSKIMVVAGGGANAIYAEAIKVEGTSQMDMEIRGSFIHGTEGIHIVASSGGYNSFIDSNIIRATDLTINDLGDEAIITRNMLISDAVAASTGAGAIVGNTSRAAGNRITCSDHLNAPWPLEGTLAG